MMMDNRITTAKDYHWATKHIRHRTKPHYLDFKNYPDQVKSYDFVKKIDLTKDLSNVDVDLNSIFIQPQPDQDHAESGRPFRLNTLSEILLLSYGVSRTGYTNETPFDVRISFDKRQMAKGICERLRGELSRF